MKIVKPLTRISEPPDVMENFDHSASDRQDWMALVREFVGKLQYGEVQISIQKGRVVEVRTMEKKRFDS